jgi:hypothetical protein
MEISPILFQMHRARYSEFSSFESERKSRAWLEVYKAKFSKVEAQVFGEKTSEYTRLGNLIWGGEGE